MLSPLIIRSVFNKFSDGVSNKTETLREITMNDCDVFCCFLKLKKRCLVKRYDISLIRRSILIPRCVGGFPLNIKFTLLFAGQVIEGPFITLDKLV